MVTSQKILLAVAITGGLLQTACNLKPTDADQKAIRVREIDAQLAHWSPTGRPDDVEKREALRKERALLSADLGYAAPALTNTLTPVAPPSVLAPPAVVIAHDSTQYQGRYQPMAPNSRWMDNNNQGHVYDRTIHKGQTSPSNGYP